MNGHQYNFPEEHQAAAAAWLARRDRGLSEAEQQAYWQWLAEDPAHARSIRQLELVWGLCDQLGQLRPAPGSQPDPDLLAPRRRPARLKILAATLGGMAALLALLLTLARPDPGAAGAPVAVDPPAATTEPAGQPVAGVDGLRVLEDGSEIRSPGDTLFEVAYTARERRIRLFRGEALFSVAHDPDRPFVVETVGVTVHALGTVFRVARHELDVAVEVTEGSVEVRNDPSMVQADFNNGIVLTGGEKVVLRYARLIPFGQSAGAQRPAP